MSSSSRLMTSNAPLLFVLGLLAILSSDHIVCSQGARPAALMAAAARQRHLLSSTAAPHHSDDEAAASGGKGATMTRGVVSPDGESGGGGGVVGAVEDARPTTPGHSPGAGHAFVNRNGVGRRLLLGFAFTS